MASEIRHDVIEHLVGTDGYAKEARRALGSAGLLALSTPKPAAWFNRPVLAAGVFLKVRGAPFRARPVARVA